MKRVIIIFFLFTNILSYAQDVIFSQAFLVPETLNSSFTGSLRSTKIGSLYRSQWRNGNFKTNSKMLFFILG